MLKPMFAILAKTICQSALYPLLMITGLLVTTNASATTFPVTNTYDAGAGSLRQAIFDVNAAGAGPHSIVFNVYGQITILSSLPAITKSDVTIDGQNKITINSNGTNPIINPFDIRANNITIRNFRLTNNGDIDVIVRTNTTGVLVENISTSSNTGNYLNSLVYVEGNSTNLTLRNLRSTDVEPCNGSGPFIGRAIYFTGGLQTNLVMDSITLNTAGNTRGCEGIVFRDASINGLTLTNTNISGFQNGIVLDNTGGPVETANNILLRNVTLDSLTTGVSLGFYSDFVNTNIQIKNTVIDLNTIGADDDGDYPIRFDNTTNGVTIDTVRLRESDIYFIWFNGAASNITINHSVLENTLPGLYGGGQFIRFEGTAGTVNISNTVLNGDKLANTDDADYGIVFVGATTNVTLDSLTLNEFDIDGIYVGAANTNFQLTNSTFTNNYDGIEFYNNVPRTNVDIINSSFRNSTRTGIAVNAANAVSDVDLTADTISNNTSHGIWVYGGASVTDMTISGNVIYNNGGAGIYNEAPNKVIYTNNAIYNNTSLGIDNAGGNCGYQSPNVPTLLSSTPLGGGQYQLQITLPAIVPTGYTVDIYANDPATSATSGQYYVTSLTGLASGTSTQTFTYNTGPGATGLGFWTATLRIPANNCGTSEFSNKLNIGIKAPACVTNGIVAWYRADMGVSGVNWADISGNANHMTGFGDPDDTTGLVNFNKAIYYDGNDEHRAPATAAVTTAYTMMGLGKLEGTQNGRVFTSSTGNKLFGWHGGYQDRLFVEAWINSNTNPLTNYTKLYSLKRASTGSGPYEFKGNGTLLNSGAASNGTAWTLDVGAGNGGEASKVFVPEVFIYNRDLLPAEIQRLESYMGLKYGITLNNGATDYVASDGTTVMWSASANSGYAKRITGIGKDDCTLLHQKQSLSADTGLVTIALGNAVTLSNAANANSVTTDKTFLVFGDNNGSSSLATAVTGINVNQRMARVWKAQKSAAWSDQNITLKIKGAGINNYLLISTDPAFGTISQELQLDASGAVTLNSSLLANGIYFTVGANIKGPGCVSTGIALWLRADDGAVTGAAWNDFSGNGNGVTQASAARQASVLPDGVNFNPALKFDGANDFLSTSSLFTATGTNNVQVYAVSVTDNIQIQDLFGELTASGQYIHAFVPYSDGNLYWDAPYGYRAQGAWGGQLGTPYLWSFLRSPATMGAYRNRATVGTYAVAMSNILGANNPFVVGGLGNGSNPFNGKIAELIVYNSSAAITATQRQQIESYLAIKYGLTLSPAAPVDYLAGNGTTKIWDIAANPGYYNRITGIGRDSCTGLNQKQSLGAEGGYVTMALGTGIAASNAANTGTITNNISYFVAGDNNGAKSYNVAVTGIPNVNVALARTWKVQKTNWADQNITLATDTTLNLPKYIIISTDAVFGTGDLALPLTNGQITLNSSQLPNGAFFTFANSLKGPGGVVTGIGAWYRGDFGLSSSQWNDNSGLGFNIPQPSVGSRPGIVLNGINFNPTATFTSPQYFGLGNAVDPATSVLGGAVGGIQNIAVFGVSTASLPASGGGGIFDQFTSNGYAIVAAPSFNNTTSYWDAPYGFRVNAPWGGTIDKPNVWGFTKTLANMSIYRDRNVLVNDNTTRDIGTITGGNYASNIGVWHGNAYYRGSIPELIVYKNIAALTATDRLKIESYLALKYGVTLNLTAVAGYLATDGTTYFDAAINAGYLKHITGIGRDSATDLYQKQSLSVDTGVVTLALGNTVATSNALNTSTITNDRSYFVFGDNGATAAFTTPVTGQPGITNRMTRIFKVDRTANWIDQNITLKLQGGNAQTYLLVSADAVFDVADTKYVLNADSTVTLNTSNLPDGIYFTFATDIKGPNGVNRGINFWLRADDGSTSGAAWKDYAGYGHQALQGVVTSQPATDAKGMNFNYGLKFDGTDDFLDINTTRVHPDSSTIFVAAFGSGFPTGRDLVSTGGLAAANGAEFRMATTLQFLEADGSSVAAVSGLSAYVDNRPYIFSGTQSNLANGAKLYQNFRFDNQATVGLSPATANFVSIGSRINAGRGLYWMGNISEVIVYNRVLTDAERQSVDSYLGLKYGITLNNGATSYLASDNTTYWTADATYKSRITGIGRDDSTALNTKISLSADTGFVTLALGTGIPITNETNSNTITNNKSFLVFGDNGLSASNFTVAFSGSTHNVTRRMARVWKLQKTNWADQNITFKVKPIGIDNYLLISSDPTFATFSQEIPVATDGTVTFSSALFNGGNIYYTFGAPLKSPGGVAGHAMWVRADIGTSSTTDNTTISEWSDLSAFANNVKQATVANQPTYLNNVTNNINFNPVVRFNGTTTGMTAGSILKAGTYTGAATFVVNSQVTPTNALVWTEPAAVGAAFSLHATWGDNIVYWDPPYTSNRLTYNTGGVDNQSILWTATSDISLVANRQSIFKNGLNVSNGNNTTQYTGSNSTFNLGMNGGGNNYNGRIAEVVIYTSALTPVQQQRVNTYLALKYGITLNSGNTNYLATDGTTTVWDATANAAYKKNIAGIGRDDEEALSQKQSRSINTGLQVTIGLSSIDSTNAANPNSFTADKNYLVWGDDSTAVNFRTPTGSANANFRMTRVWKLQETGTVGAVRVAIQSNALPNPGKSYLVVSNDNVFDATDEYILLTPQVINGINHLGATKDFNTGQFFTFATDLKVPGGVAAPALWVRADFGTSSTVDGTAINEWDDFGADINHAVQPTGASQPLYKNNMLDNINFNPVMKFDGSNDYFETVSKMGFSNGNIPISHFYVAKPASLAARNFILHLGAIADKQAYISYFNTTQMIWDSYFNIWATGPVLANNVPLLGTHTFKGGSAIFNGTNALTYRNGVQQATTLAGGTAGTINYTDATARIGNLKGIVEPFNGALPEIIVYGMETTPNERVRIETYLALKYGFTLANGDTSYLATDNTVIWDKTTHSAYKYAITGIGRDDLEGLIQKQSRNSDTTRLRVAIGLGSLAETNIDNTNSFTADRSYLIWGDDNAATSFKTPMTGNSNVNYRMTRLWTAQETGTVGQVEVAFPYDALPNPKQSYLVVSADATIDNTDTYIPLYDITLNGKKHWAAKVDFTTGQYFTVAAFIKSPGGVGATNLWVRADRNIANNTDGAPVDMWVDYGNEVNNANQAIAAIQPVYQNNATDNINYNPVVKFNGTSQYMNLDVTKLPVGTTARTLIGVGSLNNVGSSRYILGYGTAATNQGAGIIQYTSGSADFIGYANDVITANGFWQVNVPNEMFGTWAGAGGQANLYSKMASVATPVAKPWNTGTGGAQIGNSPWGAEYWSGPISELIAFDRVLSNTERQRVSTYLAIRNGYTIDQSTPYSNYLNTNSTVIWDATANTAYKNNIAGIGRDDIEGLDQRQSKSNNSGAIVAVGLGTIATDNPSNSNVFSSDSSYLIWGSNSTALTLINTDLPALYSQRLTQEWKVSLSNFNNSLAAVAMEFNLNGVTHNGTSAADFTLLIDTDGDGNFTTGTVTQIAANDYTGGKVSFNTVTALTNGAVFTLAIGPQSLRLNAKVILQGAWNGTAMTTALKTAAVLPATDPYGLSTTPSVSPNTTPAAVVDWVQVELRDSTNPATIVATRAAFVLSNGNVVDTNYTQPVFFNNVPAANYKVVIRHRNHLGIMSLNVVDFSSGVGTIDFTLSATPTYGSNARKDVGGGTMAMWAGNVNGDQSVRHSAKPSDASVVANAVLTQAGNTTASPAYTGFTNVYSLFDVNLDGKVYYTATPSDQAIIISNVTTHPANVFGLTSYIITQQLP